MPIGPGGAAEVDDETRPTDLTPPTRRQTAGIIIPAGKGDSADYSGTAMGAFWGRLGARQGAKTRRTCRIILPPPRVVELQNLTTAAAVRWGLGTGWGTRGQIRQSVDPRSAASPLIVLETTNRKTAFAREIRIEHSRGESVNRSAAKAPFPFSLLSLPPSLPRTPPRLVLTPSFAVRAFPGTKEGRRRFPCCTLSGQSVKNCATTKTRRTRRPVRQDAA